MPPSQRITRPKDSIENRRSRGEISCAECRRHKLKCDKNIPCGTCVRKGCPSICPNGTLTPSNVSRPSGTDVDGLKARIAEMSDRIRQLEDALQISHSTVSSAPHPLLAPDLLKIKTGSISSTASKKATNVIESDLLDSLVTLSVTNRGAESYMGVPDPLLNQRLGSEELGFGPSNLALSAPVSYLSKSFPFTPLFLPTQEIQEHIEEKLPSYARASALVEAYLENISWFFRPVDREQVMEELIPIVYKRRQQTTISEAQSSGSSPTSTSSGQPLTDPHVLALLLAVFAVGAAADMTLPPWNDEADLYYHLARTALGLKPVFEGCGLHAVQAIAVIGAYDLFACRKTEVEGTWKIMAFSLALAASIGLNRDPAHFKLSPKLVQRRRRVFWELYTIDVWKSTVTGRPLTFIPEVVDCEFPEDTDAKYVEDGTEMPSSIWLIRYRYSKEIILQLVTKLSAVRSVKYSEILALDQKIREYDPQGIFSLVARNAGSQHDDDNFCSTIKAIQLSLLKDITLLLLHRSFFARALIEDPANPIRTRFGPSFLSTYRSASSLVNNSRRQFERNGHYLMRLWPVWAHTLAASVTLGSIAACGSSFALAPQAYLQFNVAYEMFMRAPMHPLVKAGLPILTRLREQAQQALMKHGNAIPSQPSSPISADLQYGNEIKKEFNAVSALGKTVRRGLQGGFGTTPARLRDILFDPRMAEMHPMGSSTGMPQYSTIFTEESGRSSGLGGISDDYGLEPDCSAFQSRKSLEQSEDSGSPGQQTDRRSETDPTRAPTLASVPSVDMSPECSQAQEHTSHSPSHRPRGSLATSQPDTHTINAPEDSAFMQVDYNLYPPTDPLSNTRDGGVLGQGIDPSLFSFPGSPSSIDVFNSFMNFPDITSNSTGPSSGPFSTFLRGQEQTHSAPSSRPFSTDSSSSSYSSGMPFSTDFDVSFDMRSSSGQENVMPLLPEDMEAWRTFLQDSRFFGLGDELPESERNTPK